MIFRPTLYWMIISTLPQFSEYPDKVFEIHKKSTNFILFPKIFCREMLRTQNNLQIFAYFQTFWKYLMGALNINHKRSLFLDIQSK